MKYTDLEGISNADIWLLMLWVQAEPARKKSFFEEESVSEIADKGIKKSFVVQSLTFTCKLVEIS